jgi:hypothetical protein
MSRATTVNRRTRLREHPWERARNLSFARWATQIRRAPYGHSVPDAVGFAHDIEPPLHWSDPSEIRRLFAFSALPTGEGASYLSAVRTGQQRPEEGSLVRLSGLVKRVLPASDAAYGELLLEAQGGITPASWDEIIEGVSSRVITRIVPELSERYRLPVPEMENLLLPLVGSIPWHGRPAGLGLHLEIEGWTLARHRNFLTRLVDLVPAWVGNPRRSVATDPPKLELASGARIRRRSTPAGVPFRVQIRPVSAPPPARPRAEAAPVSVFTYGRALVSEFEAILSAGQIPLLLDAEAGRRVPGAVAEIPEELRAAVWGLHWWRPEPPDAPDWNRWLRTEEPRLWMALDALPMLPSSPSVRPWRAVVNRREFRERLAQITYARARLRGAPEVDGDDLARTVDSFVAATERAVQWADAGQGPLVHVLDRSEAGRTARLRRSLETMFREQTQGLTLEEAVAALRSGSSPAASWDVENQIERLRIRGVLFQDPSGRYRVV